MNLGFEGNMSSKLGDSELRAMWKTPDHESFG